MLGGKKKFFFLFIGHELREQMKVKERNETIKILELLLERKREGEIVTERKKHSERRKQTYK